MNVEVDYWKIGEFAKIVGGHRNTVDNWFKELENQDIHYVLRSGRMKIYDSLDLKIARYISEKRDEDWSMEGIFDSLRDGNAGLELRKDTIIEEENNTPITKEHFEELASQFLTNLRGEVKSIASSIVKEEIEARRQLLLEENEQSQREQNASQILTQKRVEDKLKEEAERKWNNLPTEDKTKKVGTLFKRREEDIEKKRKFIESYVSENFERELRSTLKLNN